MTRRDKDATWRSTGTLCREHDWSRPRLLYELQHGLRYRTFPPGHVIDWHNPKLTHGLNVETGDLTLILGVFGGPGLGVDTLTVGIEVMPPPDAEVPSPPKASARWAIAATRDLLANHKIPDGVTKAELARLLETEAQKDVKAGKLGRTLKASYIENKLTEWGIWPLNSFK